MTFREHFQEASSKIVSTKEHYTNSITYIFENRILYVIKFLGNMDFPLNFVSFELYKYGSIHNKKTLTVKGEVIGEIYNSQDLRSKDFIKLNMSELFFNLRIEEIIKLSRKENEGIGNE